MKRRTIQRQVSKVLKSAVIGSCVAAWAMQANAAIIGINPADFTLNNNGNVTPTIQNGVLTLTTGGGSQAASAFANAPQKVSNFTTSFTYTANGGADGATFTVQNDPRGASAIGSSGGTLGYGVDGANPGTPIANSAAVQFNIYQNSTTGLGTNGAINHNTPTAPVTLNSGNPVNVTLAYNGTFLRETLTDTVTGQTFGTTHIVNLPQTVGNGGNAFVGFTGATGGVSATQTIENFQYTSGNVAPFVLTGAATPIAVTGFNRDHLLANGGDSGTNDTFGGGNHLFGNNLPANGNVTSAATNALTTGATTFQLADYAANNTLKLGGDTPATGTLTLTSPGHYQSLALLTSADSAGTNNPGTVTLHYSDGSISIEGYTTSDWFSATDNPRAGAGNAFAPNNQPGWIVANGSDQNPAFTMYEADLLADPTKTLTSLDFTQANGTGATGIFAVSGSLAAATPEPASLGLIALGAVGLLRRQRRSQG